MLVGLLVCFAVRGYQQVGIVLSFTQSLSASFLLHTFGAHLLDMFVLLFQWSPLALPIPSAYYRLILPAAFYHSQAPPPQDG